MKKLILYIFIIIVLIFTMQISFKNKFKTEETLSNDIKEQYDYGEFSIIRLLHTDTNEVENIDLDSYLYGVVASEMPADFDIEALKAQAIVARTYTIYQIKNGSKHENADICDSYLCCQSWISKENRYSRWEKENADEYWNKIVSSVDTTKGKIILYNNEPINALFHSNSGGKTELSINVWGGDFPYFQTVETSGEEAYTSYSSEVTVSKDELIKVMLEKYSNFKINFEENNSIEILEYNFSGRVQKIKIGNIELSGVDVRKLFSLKSSNFTFEISGDNIIFSVIGYGHGVGLSQCGSDVLAKNGLKAEEIIKYYYKDVEISE